jgi:hypothetical protein
MTANPDADLIDEALDVVHDARARAPADFIIALGVVLGIAAVVLLAVAAVTSGASQDLFLNLGVEVIGAWLTVVLINGLWRRLEVGASASLDAMSARLHERRGSPLSDGEREAWRLFVDEYRELTGSMSWLERVRALPAYRRRMQALEASGNRTLEEFRRVAEEAPAPQ